MKLYLEDETRLEGWAFGAHNAVAGEVVFNTDMAGYVETLTDPSYKGQILVLTYPLVGNYGVPPARPVGSLDSPYESSRIQVQGLIVQHYVDAFSHHAATRSLSDWLKSEGVPAVTGVDTRQLTKRLREKGTMNGWLSPRDMLFENVRVNAASVDMDREVFEVVAPEKPVEYPGGDLRILLVDIGAKDNIVRSLLERGASVVRAPWHWDLKEYSDRMDGIVIGNGPGDPKQLGSLIEQIRGMLGTFRKPLFGIFLGNQTLTLAAGGDTY